MQDKTEYVVSILDMFVKLSQKGILPSNMVTDVLDLLQKEVLEAGTFSNEELLYLLYFFEKARDMINR